MPDHWDVTDSPSNKYPLRLIAAPARQFLNSTFTETSSARKMEKEPTLLIHPDDLESFSLTDGATVQVSSKVGEILIKVCPFEGLQRGTVVIESIWGNRDFPGGAGVNTLVSSEAAKPNGGAVFHDTAVKVSALKS